MRKVVAYVLLSLDGVAEAPEEFIVEWDELMDENLRRVISTQDTVLLGRRTFDEWSEFWPNSAVEPFASFINGVKKYVVTSTPTHSTWSNSTVISENLIGVLQDLKQRSGGDIGLHGSIALTQSLLASGNVDEMQLVIAPKIQSRGVKFFDHVTSSALTLRSSATTPSGSLLLHYLVKNQ